MSIYSPSEEAAMAIRRILHEVEVGHGADAMRAALAEVLGDFAIGETYPHQWLSTVHMETCAYMARENNAMAAQARDDMLDLDPLEVD